MAARRTHGSGSESRRKISKMGSYTYYITIPKDLVQELGWRERQMVTVKREGKKLVVERGK